MELKPSQKKLKYSKKEPTVCVWCRKEIDTTDKYCRHCGKALAGFFFKDCEGCGRPFKTTKTDRTRCNKCSGGTKKGNPFGRMMR